MASNLLTPLADTQSQADHRNLPIDKVGVKGLRYPIQVRDRTVQVQETVATVSLIVDLPHHFKGTHMSRFIEALNAHGRLMHVENIPEILHSLRTKLDAEAAHLSMEFPYFIEKAAPVTKARGLVDYTVRFEASAYGPKKDFVLTVVVPVTTLCPCSKAISTEGAHSQRGYATVSVRFAKVVWIEDLIALVESCASSEIFSLLKRPDEKYVTEQAYRNPVFVEDLVRNIADRLRADPKITWFKAEAENMESIHNHAAYASIEKKMDDTA